jgi:hypothetical protein
LSNSIGLAQAGTTPKDTSPAGMIPGQSVKAPAYVPEQKGFFGRLGDQLGLSEDTQMNISNLSNAFAGATGSAYIPSYLPKVGTGIAGLGERLYNRFSPQAGTLSQKGIAELQAANKAADIQQSVKGAQEAGSTLEEQDYIRKMMEANQKAQMPSKAMEVQNASNLREATDTARMVEGANAAQMASKAAAATNMPSAQTNATSLASVPDSNLPPDDGFSSPDFSSLAPTPGVDKIADTVTQGAKGGRDWNDFLLNMGLGLMAGKSPYALQNLGEAGIGALRQEQEAKKQALEERKIASEEAYQKALSAHYGVTPEIQLVQAMKDPEFAKQYQSLVSAKSGPMTQKDLIDNYMKTLKGQTGDFSGFNDFVQQMSPYMGTMPSGVTVTKRGG